MNLNKLRDKAYQCAVAHGWHDENLSDEHFLCLVISELMEAVEADRKGMHANRANFEYYMKQRKRDDGEFMYAFKQDIKDSVEDELADACIRMLDLAGLRGYDLDSFDYEGSDTEDYSDMTFTESMFRICVYVTDNFYRDELYILLNEIFAFCRDRNIDIFWHIKQKMKYNELRPYKHGDKSY
ncbi:hypothetical protein [Phocaeicola plebeius]|jgi:hypothetical protein|uniref:hypothetical protein n=1 Tax=Phocaeicola plebeius TaxID=310297 RepID=UPI0026EAEFB8|nr:hypothetical protein [Phocaeicola plebeius]